ncbi:hypothetical protein [Phytohabitans houttuyneae]|uniref:Uncharacterized protein n=1 Tax=Phytohabitans houttuyneae TaxID=1076126 RepID=A0A6V8K5R3_9ACTN|nr:hypothetical protein [Phytohabitans houttuyneae]GFJ77326.1 hypothetical protein Phou_015060 [Phytohabitans houttuyneae]
MNDPATRALWMAIAIIVAAFVATAAGALTWVDGRRLPRAVLTGGAAFAGTLLLLLAAIMFVADQGPA